MSRLRAGRRKYYDLFSHCYDGFIRLHAPRDAEDTRHFLVDSATRKEKSPHHILDICCGTGSAIIAFGKRYPDAVLVGYDFSLGMLRNCPSQMPVLTRLPFPTRSMNSREKHERKL